MQLLAYGASKTAQFQAAIMQSTALEPGMVTNISFSATLVIAAAAGWIAIDAYSKSPALVECLRALSMETLLDLTNSFITETSSNNDGDIVLHTTDQDFLPKVASGFFASKKLPKIVYMTGWMENDVALSLIPQSPPRTIPAHFSSSATHTSIPPQ
jgi:carboxylesterase type B